VKRRAEVDDVIQWLASGATHSPRHLPSRWRKPIYLRDLLLELVTRDIKLRYNRSVLGLGWSLLVPLAQMLVFHFIFRSVLSIDIPNYHLFAFSGLLIWGWFQSSLVAAAGAITDNRELLRRPSFPVDVLPIIPVITQFVQFLLALPILFLFVELAGVPLTTAYLALPAVAAVQLMLTMSVAYLLATFQVWFRDTQHFTGVALLMVFYLSPVIYDASLVPDAYARIYDLNPMVHLMAAYRSVILRGELPNTLALLAVGTASACLLWFGHAVFARASHRFAEEL
jgi:lipopolysaccharide transport system permease protein